MGELKPGWLPKQVASAKLGQKNDAYASEATNEGVDLRAKLTTVEEYAEKVRVDCLKAIERYKTAEAANARLRGALMFYAIEENWIDRDNGEPKISSDDGAVARDALLSATSAGPVERVVEAAKEMDRAILAVTETDTNPDYSMDTHHTSRRYSNAHAELREALKALRGGG